MTKEKIDRIAYELWLSCASRVDVSIPANVKPRFVEILEKHLVTDEDLASVSGTINKPKPSPPPPPRILREGGKVPKPPNYR